MQNQENKFRYFIDGKEVDNRTDYLNATMSGDYVSYFDDNSVFSVSFNSFFGENVDNNKMIKREVNGHIIDILGLGQIVGDLEGINKPPKIEQLNYQSFYQVVYTKPESNWNKFEIAFSDKDLEKIKDLSIGDIKEMFNSTISAEKTEKEENLVFPKDSEIHKDDVITNTSRGEKETMEYLNEAPFGSFGKRGKKIDYSIGIKESNGKTDYSEIDWEFIESLAKRMNKNKGKYEAGNYRKPMDIDLLKQSLLRHVLEVLKGNYQDDGDDLGHLSAIALNAQFLYYQLKNNQN